VRRAQARCAIFSDYRLIPPFTQLTRKTCDAAPGSWTSRLERLAGKRTAGKRLFGLEGRRGWERPGVGRSVKTVGDAQVCLTYSPGIVGGPNATHTEEQTVQSITLENATPAELHPIVRSEILCDLETLEAP
jgi:hypothetical protein